ncbi:MAG: dynamin family protein [Saprospiraceae bacterium]|nr:dynamin family protein [Saprospiraceae bacterium]MCF8248515.1 dynamin family protein [Saprospiraceae bacterium]MCF8280586.1 dynamin family protein [Bacteroidales bacterium]MCF8310249.1 dynamin family protein [Saprospiraceae bacterium]MCF8439312.1 dynamin family protein [Saprospiraceae bacterium]
MTQILDDKLQGLRSHIDEIAKDLHDLTVDIGHQELRQTVSELRNRINEPFMFVIVGEVKAGKSSFVNALLSTGKEVCKVAPQPMTDTIQQVIWGETEQVISINPYLKKITHPVEILKEIAIVDTPGTNTIVEHHQEITERFIPSSDLIVFVFEAKNPYRQSAWEFFDFINTEWRRKVIFVLQQKDLMAPDELPVNVQGVVQHAQKKGIEAPIVFAVSAKLEQEGNEQASGFLPLREYIRENITGGKAPALKLTNNISTCRNLNERIGKGIADRLRQLKADQQFRQEVTETLVKQEAKSLRQVEMLVENLLSGYDRITLTTEEELVEGLGFFSLLKRTIAGIFSKKASAQEWLEALAKDLDQQLHLELQNKLNDNVADLADSIQQMAKMIDLKIHKSETILRNNHEIFSDIADRRATVMGDLQETFTKFLNRPENFSADQLFPDKKPASGSIATGSGLAVVGVILAAVTKLAVFDVTGGVLTAVGVLFAGFTSAAKKRKIVEGYQTEITKGRGLLQEELSGKLRTYVTGIKTKIDANFEDFDAMLEKEEAQVAKLEERQGGIEGRLAIVERDLE